MIRSLGGSPKDLAKPVRLPDEMPDAPTAVARSMRLLDSTTDQFFHKSSCFACHEQPPAEFAAAAARAKGIPVDEKVSHQRVLQITSTINLGRPGGSSRTRRRGQQFVRRRSTGAWRVSSQSHYGFPCSEPGCVSGRRRRMASSRVFAISVAGQRFLAHGDGHACLKDLRPSRARERNETAHRTRQAVADACRSRDPGGYGYAPGRSCRRRCECGRTSQTGRADSGAAAPGRRLGATPRISERCICYRHDAVGSE